MSQQQKQPNPKQQKPKQGQGQGQGQGQCQGQGAAQSPGQADGTTKTKAELKAERRTKQEAQRAAKLAAQGGGGQPPKTCKKDAESLKKTDSTQHRKAETAKELKRVPDNIVADDDKTTKKLAKKLEKQQVPKRTEVQKKVRLFNHLHQYEREVSLTKDIKFNMTSIHPVILRLGLQYAEGVICGSNARCIALLGALKQVISDYNTPLHKELCRDLDAKLKPCISFLTQCRPLAVCMGNAIKHLKWHINHLRAGITDQEARETLHRIIDEYRLEKIVLAGKAISIIAVTKIEDNDTIMVYGYSSLIKQVLREAHKQKKQFRIIVVDGRPKLEGREMLRQLVQMGIDCSYVLVNAASYVMREVTKVFLGAHALLANGYVMSRVGSSQVALLAKSYNVPVLVCCETYKFCERVQTDSFVFNELGDPDDLVQTNTSRVHLEDWRDKKSLSLLNLTYDVTPSALVSVVITELGMVPCTSVPVVLRVKQVETETT